MSYASSSASIRIASKSTSPKSSHNAFSPLSPELFDRNLHGYLAEGWHEPEGDGSQRKHSKGGRRYSRDELLDIARSCRKTGWRRPPGLGQLETWFGPSLSRASHAQTIEDPIIASIGPPNSASRRGGGFGEGFGFGGGIGGRNLGRGTTGKNMGLRRNHDLDSDTMAIPIPGRSGTGQSSRYSGRTHHDKTKSVPEEQSTGHDRRAKREDVDWRRDAGPSFPTRIDNRAQTRRNYHAVEDDAEPSWMASDDSGPSPFATENTTLSRGYDRALGQVPSAYLNPSNTASSSGDKGLVSFFGGSREDNQPVDIPTKLPKNFNSADYLLPSRGSVVQPQVKGEGDVNDKTGKSRFHRFFGAPMGQVIEGKDTSIAPNIPTARNYPSGDSSSPGPFPALGGPLHADDHMARLMGLLTMQNMPNQPPPQSNTNYTASGQSLQPAEDQSRGRPTHSNGFSDGVPTFSSPSLYAPNYPSTMPNPGFNPLPVEQQHLINQQIGRPDVHFPPQPQRVANMPTVHHKHIPPMLPQLSKPHYGQPPLGPQASESGVPFFPVPFTGYPPRMDGVRVPAAPYSGDPTQSYDSQRSQHIFQSAKQLPYGHAEGRSSEHPQTRSSQQDLLATLFSGLGGRSSGA